MTQWAFMFFVCGTAALLTVLKQAYDRAQKARAREVVGEPARGEPTRPAAPTRASVQARITDDQWEALEQRMGGALELEVEACDSWTKTKPRRCLGLISLDVGDAWDRKEPHPIPLLRVNRARLQQLGFRISDDNLWATYEEEEEEEDEKAVVEERCEGE